MVAANEYCVTRMSLSIAFTENEKRIVSRIYREGSLSKQQIADAEGLSWGTIVKFVSSLEAQDILETSGTVDRPPQRGKNAYTYDFTGRYPRAIGVDIEYHSTSIIVTNLKRQILFEHHLPSGDLESIGSIEEFLGDALEHTVEAFGDRGSIMGVGIGIPGVGVPVLSVPGGESRKDELIDRLQSRLRLPVEIALNTQAYTMFERWFRTGFTADDFLFVSIRSGVGTGIILNRQLHAGLRDLAGAFGHFTMVADGIVCRCGKRGCLETVVNEPSLIESYSAASGRSINRLEELFEAADQGEDVAARIVAEAAGYLGEAIGNTLLVLNIFRVIVSAHFGGSFDFFAQRLKEAVEAHLLPVQEVELEVVPLDPQGFTQGAALLVFNRIFL